MILPLGNLLLPESGGGCSGELRSPCSVGTECSNAKSWLIATWTEQHFLQGVDGCLKYFAKCKRTVVMAHHLDFLVFNSFMGKFCPIHIHSLNLKGTLELTFVFPGNFLILSSVSVVFALHYCSVCSSEAKVLVLDVQDAILKPSNLLLNKTKFILTFQSSNSTFSLEVDIELIVCYKVTQNMET